MLIPVQRRKNADLQDSGFIYDHGPMSTLLRSDAWTGRPQFHFLNVTDFKGLCAG
jgi:hypothetical protein